MKKGLLITVEGTDGAGKSTQIDFINKYFKKEGRRPIFIREPGSTAIGEKIRDILLDKKYDNMSYITEMMLYAAARAQLVEEIIKPSLEKGQVVICDRFLDSSIAYQGYGRQLGDVVMEVNRHAIQGIIPDLTILLDIPVEISRNRMMKNGCDSDRIEAQSINFHDKVVRGYRELARKFPDRIKKIEGNRTVEEVSREIERYLDELG